MSDRPTELVRRDEQLPARYEPIPVRHLFEEVTRYDPTPTTPPTPDPELPHLPWLERLAGVVSYTFGRWLHALSPGGGIVEWMKICFRAFLVILGPLLLLPLLILAVKYAVELVGQLVLLMIAVLKAIAAACGIVLALLVLRSLFRQSRQPRQPPR